MTFTMPNKEFDLKSVRRHKIPTPSASTPKIPDHSVSNAHAYPLPYSKKGYPHHKPRVQYTKNLKSQTNDNLNVVPQTATNVKETKENLSTVSQTATDKSQPKDNVNLVSQTGTNNKENLNPVIKSTNTVKVNTDPESYLYTRDVPFRDNNVKLVKDKTIIKIVHLPGRSFKPHGKHVRVLTRHHVYATKPVGTTKLRSLERFADSDTEQESNERDAYLIDEYLNQVNNTEAIYPSDVGAKGDDDVQNKEVSDDRNETILKQLSAENVNKPEVVDEFKTRNMKLSVVTPVTNPITRAIDTIDSKIRRDKHTKFTAVTPLNVQDPITKYKHNIFLYNRGPGAKPIKLSAVTPASISDNEDDQSPPKDRSSIIKSPHFKHIGHFRKMIPVTPEDEYVEFEEVSKNIEGQENMPDSVKKITPVTPVIFGRPHLIHMANYEKKLSPVTPVSQSKEFQLEDYSQNTEVSIALDQDKPKDTSGEEDNGHAMNDQKYVKHGFQLSEESLGKLISGNRLTSKKVQSQRKGFIKIEPEGSSKEVQPHRKGFVKIEPETPSDFVKKVYPANSYTKNSDSRLKDIRFVKYGLPIDKTNVRKFFKLTTQPENVATETSIQAEKDNDITPVTESNILEVYPYSDPRKSHLNAYYATHSTTKPNQEIAKKPYHHHFIKIDAPLHPYNLDPASHPSKDKTGENAKFTDETSKESKDFESADPQLIKVDFPLHPDALNIVHTAQPIVHSKDNKSGWWVQDTTTVSSEPSTKKHHLIKFGLPIQKGALDELATRTNKSSKVFIFPNDRNASVDYFSVLYPDFHLKLHKAISKVTTHSQPKRTKTKSTRKTLRDKSKKYTLRYKPKKKLREGEDQGQSATEKADDTKQKDTNGSELEKLVNEFMINTDDDAVRRKRKTWLEKRLLMLPKRPYVNSTRAYPEIGFDDRLADGLPGVAVKPLFYTFFLMLILLVFFAYKLYLNEKKMKRKGSRSDEKRHSEPNSSRSLTVCFIVFLLILFIDMCFHFTLITYLPLSSFDIEKEQTIIYFHYLTELESHSIKFFDGNKQTANKAYEADSEMKNFSFNMFYRLSEEYEQCVDYIEETADIIRSKDYIVKPIYVQSVFKQTCLFFGWFRYHVMTAIWSGAVGVNASWMVGYRPNIMLCIIGIIFCGCAGGVVLAQMVTIAEFCEEPNRVLVQMFNSTLYYDYMNSRMEYLCKVWHHAMRVKIRQYQRTAQAAIALVKVNEGIGKKLNAYESFMIDSDYAKLSAAVGRTKYNEKWYDYFNKPILSLNLTYECDIKYKFDDVLEEAWPLCNDNLLTFWLLLEMLLLVVVVLVCCFVIVVNIIWMDDRITWDNIGLLNKSSTKIAAMVKKAKARRRRKKRRDDDDDDDDDSEECGTEPMPCPYFAPKETHYTIMTAKMTGSKNIPRKIPLKRSSVKKTK